MGPGTKSNMNVRASLIMNESIDRETRGREGWMATHGKEMGLDKIAAKKKKERENRPKSELAQTRVAEEEEEEEARPLSLVYNQERYPIRYDMARWADRAIVNGYGKMNFRT